MIVLYLGLIVWFATFVLVESELFRPFREWVAMHADAAELWLDDAPYEPEPAKAVRRAKRTYARWHKARYLVGCHTCSGTWVGLAVAALSGVRPVGSGVVGFVFAGLLFKAVGHLILVAHKAGESYGDRQG